MASILLMGLSLQFPKLKFKVLIYSHISIYFRTLNIINVWALMYEILYLQHIIQALYWLYEIGIIFLKLRRKRQKWYFIQVKQPRPKHFKVRADRRLLRHAGQCGYDKWVNARAADYCSLPRVSKQQALRLSASSGHADWKSRVSDLGTLTKADALYLELFF